MKSLNMKCQQDISGKKLKSESEMSKKDQLGDRDRQTLKNLHYVSYLSHKAPSMNVVAIKRTNVA